MFGRKKINDNPFGDKNYQMKDYYNPNYLIVANFQRVSSSSMKEMHTPITETTEQKYIFEVFYDEDKMKYREIFTGFIASDEDSGIFNLPYIVNPEPFTNYFPKAVNTRIPKLSLIWSLNEINYPAKKKELKKN